MSAVPSCSIRVEPIPTKPINVARAVRTDNVTVFVDEKGRIYSTGIKNGFAYTPGFGNRQNQIDTYQCLVKLGIISKWDALQHKLNADAISAKNERKWAADAILKDSEKLGLKFTAAQLKQIEAAKSAATV